MKYVLKKRPKSIAAVDTAKVVPPRPSHLRRGGGRKDSQGWTDQKRRTIRRRLDELRPCIKTGVTIILPEYSIPSQLKALDGSIRSFCKDNEIAAFAVWEGPKPHVHLALGIEWSETLESKWLRRLAKKWQRVFAEQMPSNAFLWKPQQEPNKIASYLSKTTSKRAPNRGQIVKGNWPWLCLSPFPLLAALLESGNAQLEEPQ